MAEPGNRLTDAQRIWARAALAAVVGSVVYHLLSGASLWQSAIFGLFLFVGWGLFMRRRSTKGDNAAAAAEAAVRAAMEPKAPDATSRSQGQNEPAAH